MGEEELGISNWAYDKTWFSPFTQLGNESWNKLVLKSII